MSNGASITYAAPGKQSSRSAHPTFHALAGLLSGIASAVLLQPADLLKTRVQQSGSASLFNVIKEIARGPHPLKQLWRGTLPSTLRTGIGSALYFTSLNSLRQSVAKASQKGLVPSLVQGHDDGSTSGAMAARSSPASLPTNRSSSTLPKLSNTANLLTGAVARASVGFVMMPITVIKVRYESNFFAYRSLAHASTDILQKEGLKGFFAGFGATAVRDAPYAGLYVLFYEWGKKTLSAFNNKNDTVLAKVSSEADVVPGTRAAKPGIKEMSRGTSISINFVSGLFAAALATAITNPFDAIKTRLQLMPSKYGNMVKAAKMMVAQEGVRSLFDGLALRMGRKALSSALAWTVYEECIRRAERRMF